MSNPGSRHDETAATRSAAGFTLLELIVAILMIGIGLLSVAPLFVHAQRQSASSADLGSAGAVATQRQEALRAQSFKSLAAGGSLSTDAPGYSDLSTPGYTVRWTITDDAFPAKRKTITVRAIRMRQVVGPAKEVLLSTLRAR